MYTIMYTSMCVSLQAIAIRCSVVKLGISNIDREVGGYMANIVFLNGSHFKQS